MTSEQRIAELEAENQRLRAQLDRLPKSADKASIAPGDVVFSPRDGMIVTRAWKRDGLNETWWVHENSRLLADRPIYLDKCYSTREAAEAAEETS